MKGRPRRRAASTESSNACKRGHEVIHDGRLVERLSASSSAILVALESRKLAMPSKTSQKCSDSVAYDL